MRATCPCGRALAVDPAARVAVCPGCGRSFRLRSGGPKAAASSGSSVSRPDVGAEASSHPDREGAGPDGPKAGRRPVWAYVVVLVPVFVAGVAIVVWRSGRGVTPPPARPAGASDDAVTGILAASTPPDAPGPRGPGIATPEPHAPVPVEAERPPQPHTLEASTAPAADAGGDGLAAGSPGPPDPAGAAEPAAGERPPSVGPDLLVLTSDGVADARELLREAADRLGASGDAAAGAGPSLRARSDAVARIAGRAAAAGDMEGVSRCEAALRAALAAADEEERRLAERVPRAAIAIAAAKAHVAGRNRNGRAVERFVAEARRAAAAGPSPDRDAAEVAALAGAARGAFAAGDPEAAKAYRRRVAAFASADAPAREAALREAALLCLEAEDEVGLSPLLDGDRGDERWRAAWKSVVVPAAELGYEAVALDVSRRVHAAGNVALQVALTTVRTKSLDLAGARKILGDGLDDPSEGFAAACDLAATSAECGPLCDAGAADAVRRLRAVYEASDDLRGLRQYTLPPLAAAERLARKGPSDAPAGLAAELSDTDPGRRNAAFVRVARARLHEGDAAAAEAYCRKAARLLWDRDQSEPTYLDDAAAVGRVLREIGFRRAEARGPDAPRSAMLTAGLLAGIAEASLARDAVRRDVDRLHGAAGEDGVGGRWATFWASPGAAPSVTDDAILLAATYGAWPADPSAEAAPGRLVCVSGGRAVAAFADGWDLGVVFPADRARLTGLVGVATDDAIDDAVRGAVLEAVTAPLGASRGSGGVTVTKGRARVAGATWVRLTIRDERPRAGG